MTTDRTHRDDPESRRQSATQPSGETPSRRHSEGRFLSWLVQALGASLVEDGLPPALVERIMLDASQDYARWHRTIKRPHLFLMKSVVRRAAQQIKLLDVDGEPAPEEQAPSLLQIVQTQEALDTLPADARTALRMLVSEGRSHEEIAAELGMSLWAAQAFIEKAILRLAKWRPRK